MLLCWLASGTTPRGLICLHSEHLSRLGGGSDLKETAEHGVRVNSAVLCASCLKVSCASCNSACSPPLKFQSDGLYLNFLSGG